MKSILLCTLFAWSTLACAGEEFADIQAKVVCFKLDNGLTVILYPRGNAPAIACVTYVKAGSSDEHVGITGIAHQLEHLAFKGTPHIGTRDYAAEKKLLQQLDDIYAQLQQTQQKLPAEMRDALLSLLAKLSGSDVSADLVENELRTLETHWKQAGFSLPEADRTLLAALLKDFKAKIAEAESYVEQNQYAEVINRNGGSGLNAFTSADRTVYHVSLPSNKLELWAALESDRYLNTVPRQLEKEKQVVLEERRMRTENNPFGKLYEIFLGTAFQAHPYGVAVIGHRSDILAYTRGKVRDFYRRHYVPQNTILCVVGDIDVAAARKIISDYFGRIPAGPLPQVTATVEPQQKGERRAEVEHPSQPLLLLGYHVPERNHPDTPALVMLDEIATSGRTSRFYSRLVKAGLAASVSSWFGPGARFPRLLMFSSEPVQGGSVDELEAALLAEIEKLKTEPASPEELRRVIARYRAQVLRELMSNMQLAQELADHQALSGDWRQLFCEIQQMSEVKPEQITRVANKYLTRQNRTLASILSPDAPAPPTPQTILGVPGLLPPAEGRRDPSPSGRRPR